MDGVKSVYAQVRWESGKDGGLISGETLVCGARDSDLRLGFIISWAFGLSLNFF